MTKSVNVLTVQIGDMIYRPSRVDAKTFRKLHEIPFSSPIPQYYRKWKGEILFFPALLQRENAIISEHRETYDMS